MAPFLSFNSGFDLCHSSSCKVKNRSLWNGIHVNIALTLIFFSIYVWYSWFESHTEKYIFTIRAWEPVLLLLFFIILVFSLYYVTIAMYLVYRTVRNGEVEVERYSFARYTLLSRQKNMELSHRVMVQGILYSAALASSICLTVILANSFAFNSCYAVEVLTSIVLPLQGLWNALTYKSLYLRKLQKRYFWNHDKMSLLAWSKTIKTHF